MINIVVLRNDSFYRRTTSHSRICQGAGVGSLIAANISRYSGDARRSRDQNESGSVLILAMAFLLAISLIVGALANWAMNDLNNTTKFNSASSLNYAATSATQVAIQSIRYSPLMPQTQSPALNFCWTPQVGYVSQLSNFDGFTVAVWCSTVQTLSSARTRVVTLIACTSTLNPNITTSSLSTVQAAASACQASPLLTARVAFDDYPSAGGAPLSLTCTTWCGQGATTELWVWSH
jgi:hypothetical protein